MTLRKCVVEHGAIVPSQLVQSGVRPAQHHNLISTARPHELYRPECLDLRFNSTGVEAQSDLQAPARPGGSIEGETHGVPAAPFDDAVPSAAVALGQLDRVSIIAGHVALFHRVLSFLSQSYMPAAEPAPIMAEGN